MFGFTDVSPDNKPVPSLAFDCRNHWIVCNNTLYHNSESRGVNFNPHDLKVGQSLGCCVTRNGELRYFIDGVDQGIAWTGLLINRPMWGVADVYGHGFKIKVFVCVSVCRVTHSRWKLYSVLKTATETVEKRSSSCTYS